MRGIPAGADGKTEALRLSQYEWLVVGAFFNAKIKGFMNVHIENDKINAPFLLACSFSGLIEFIGNYSKNGVVYWQFSPKDKAEALLTQLETKKSPPIPPLDLFNAIETFWRQVAQAKGKRNLGINYGK